MMRAVGLGAGVGAVLGVITGVFNLWVLSIGIDEVQAWLLALILFLGLWMAAIVLLISYLESRDMKLGLDRAILRGVRECGNVLRVWDDGPRRVLSTGASAGEAAILRLQKRGWIARADYVLSEEERDRGCRGFVLTAEGRREVV